ncbi:MAG: O-methyltransferase [Bilifractor sp.]
MITDPRMSVFLDSFYEGNSPFLEDLEERAKKDRIPIIRRGMQSLIRVLLQMQRPENILEVGTATGFSAILMAEYGPDNCHITTIENYEKRIPEARNNISSSGHQNQITLIEGDAADVLQRLSDPFDFIFMDAAKGQYPAFLPEILRLLAPGGVLLSDNVLQDGDLIESHYIVERRNRTIYKRMRDYLYTITHHPELTTTILPVGDGAAVSVKKAEELWR